MPHRSLPVLFVAAIATLNVLTGAAQSQTPAPPPLTYERAITMTWKNLHDRILEMAKDTVFPDDKLGWKPHPDSRSVLAPMRFIRCPAAVGPRPAGGADACAMASWRDSLPSHSRCSQAPRSWDGASFACCPWIWGSRPKRS